mmetsp:Transcript_59737/g.187306  ORF Transcript_59737/g.187306 Transcript_59737/m.187306 type:complete len:223 (+) Transcript_59737:1076-1744(+)
MPRKKMGVRGTPKGSRCMGLARMTMGRRRACASDSTCTESRNALGRPASSTISAHSRASWASETSTRPGREPPASGLAFSWLMGSKMLSRPICKPHRRRMGSATRGSWNSWLMAARSVESPPLPRGCRGGPTSPAVPHEAGSSHPTASIAHGAGAPLPGPGRQPSSRPVPPPGPPGGRGTRAWSGRAPQTPAPGLAGRGGRSLSASGGGARGPHRRWRAAPG